MFDAYSAGEDSAISERKETVPKLIDCALAHGFGTVSKIIKINPGRISGVKEAVLGTTFVGERIFLCDGRYGDAGDDTGIYRTPV
jgi:hypothetical protein